MKKENLRTIFSFHLHRCLIIIGLLCADVPLNSFLYIRT